VDKVTLATAPEVKRVITAADPTYRKRDAFLRVTSQCTLSGTYWDGGSRSTYHAVDISTGRVLPAPQYNPPQFGGPRTDPTVDIPDGVAIVRTGVFCGKTATATVYVNPNTAAPLLPQ
jgi:hypothetical protein